MILRAIEKDDIEKIRKWRQGKGYMLRTETEITPESQENWYKNIVSNRDSKIKFWAVVDKCLVGYATLEIDYMNGYGELGLLIGDKYQRNGYGHKAIKILIDKAFGIYRLHHVVWESYDCNPNNKFWEQITREYNGRIYKLPLRKFYNNKYWDAQYGIIINEK